MHVRAQVRGEVAARLTQSEDVSSAGVTHVHPGRVWPWRDGHLPAISVHVRDEEIEVVASGGTLQRRMTIIIEVVVEAHGSPDDTLDAIGAAVERAVLQPASMAGLCIQPHSVRIDVGQRGERVTGVLVHEYECSIFCDAADPEKII